MKQANLRDTCKKSYNNVRNTASVVFPDPLFSIAFSSWAT
jgi:hypothetical protein